MEKLQADAEWLEQKRLLVRTLREIRDLLVKYQRDSEAILFRDSHKCRRLCEEALTKVRG